MDVYRMPLMSGGFAFVDVGDRPALDGWRWSWTKNSRGYVSSRRCIGGGKQIQVTLHRLLLDFPQSAIDHINGNRLDNRRCNLRLCTNSQNQANREPMPHGSRFKGVTVQKKTGRFESQIWFQNKRIYLGTFEHEEEAAAAYDREAIARFGEFARLNFL